MDLHLDPRERELLMELLERRIEGLQHEIHHTDHRSFKTDLKAEETLAKSLLAKLRLPVPASI